ncbi:biotin transporter BioY [Pediococcus acidilactici]|nr:biotin transporter BioY [Pediococcus acidilactici]
MRFDARSITKMALLLAIIIGLGLVPNLPIGLIPVPITVQNIGILLVGLILTPGEAAITIDAFLLLALVGIPVLTGMRGGVAVFMGPTGGYLLGYLVGAVLLAWWTSHGRQDWFGLFAKVAIIAVLVIDLLGIVGFAINMRMAFFKAVLANAIFIPGDVIKSALVALIGRRLKIK